MMAAQGCTSLTSGAGTGDDGVRNGEVGGVFGITSSPGELLFMRRVGV